MNTKGGKGKSPLFINFPSIAYFQIINHGACGRQEIISGRFRPGLPTYLWPCKDNGEKHKQTTAVKCAVYISVLTAGTNTKGSKRRKITVSAHATSGQGSTTMTGAFVVLCGCGQKQAVVVFCENFVEVICPVCNY